MRVASEHLLSAWASDSPDERNVCAAVPLQTQPLELPPNVNKVFLLDCDSASSPPFQHLLMFFGNKLLVAVNGTATAACLREDETKTGVVGKERQE